MIIGNGKIKYCDNELLKELMRDIPDNYSIGLHNIGIFPKSAYNFTKQPKKVTEDKVAKSIMKNGFIATGDLSMTVTAYGYLKNILENKDGRRDSFLTYNFWKTKKIENVIIAIPPTIRLDGKDYFIGVLENNYYSIWRDFPPGYDTNLLNQGLLKHKIPSEFIYGTFSRDPKDSSGEKEENLVISDVTGKSIYSLNKNQNFIANKSSQEQEEFYKKLIDEKKVDKSILEQINNKDMSSNDERINVTIAQKKAYEEDFKGRRN